MKIIDAHNHPDWHGHNLERFIANMDQYGISKTWLFSWECERNEYSESTEAVIPAPVLGTTTGPIPFARCLSYPNASFSDTLRTRATRRPPAS